MRLFKRKLTTENKEVFELPGKEELNTVAINKIVDQDTRESAHRRRFLKKFHATPVTADIYAEWFNVYLKSVDRPEIVYANHDFISSTNGTAVDEDDDSYWLNQFWFIEDENFTLSDIPLLSGAASLDLFIHPAVKLSAEDIDFTSTVTSAGHPRFGHTELYVFGYWENDELVLSPKTTTVLPTVFKDTITLMDELNE